MIKKNEDKRIRTIEQLKELAVDGLDCSILLNEGLRSSKHIRYYPEENNFYLFHYIDGSEEKITEKQLLESDYSNIGEAMGKGALMMD